MGTSLDPLLVFKPGHSATEAKEFASSCLASFVRLGSGAMVGALGARPERRLVLYELEACPNSRKVREALSVLDLDADIRPCPIGSDRFRVELAQYVHVKDTTPVLIDPNTTAVIQDSDKIVGYLFKTYGRKKVPLMLRRDGVLGRLSTLTLGLATMLRPGRGQRARSSTRPARELELYGYESSPYCRFVRESLDELAIPYVVHNLARNSPKRASFADKTGKLQFPYLVDPNTGVSMFESRAIVDYLERTYSALATSTTTGDTRGQPRANVKKNGAPEGPLSVLHAH